MLEIMHRASALYRITGSPRILRTSRGALFLLVAIAIVIAGLRFKSDSGDLIVTAIYAERPSTFISSVRQSMYGAADMIFDPSQKSQLNSLIVTALSSHGFSNADISSYAKHSDKSAKELANLPTYERQRVEYAKILVYLATLPQQEHAADGPFFPYRGIVLVHFKNGTNRSLRHLRADLTSSYEVLQVKDWNSTGCHSEISAGHVRLYCASLEPSEARDAVVVVGSIGGKTLTEGVKDTLDMTLDGHAPIHLSIETITAPCLLGNPNE